MDKKILSLLAILSVFYGLHAADMQPHPAAAQLRAPFSGEAPLTTVHRVAAQATPGSGAESDVVALQVEPGSGAESDSGAPQVTVHRVTAQATPVALDFEAEPRPEPRQHTFVSEVDDIDVSDWFAFLKEKANSVGNSAQGYFTAEGDNDSSFVADAKNVRDAAAKGAKEIAGVAGDLLEDFRAFIDPKGRTSANNDEAAAIHGGLLEEPLNLKSYPDIIRQIWKEDRTSDFEESSKLASLIAKASKFEESARLRAEKSKLIGEQVGGIKNQLIDGLPSAGVGALGAYSAERALQALFGLESANWKRSLSGEASYISLLTIVSQWAAMQNKLIAKAENPELKKRLITEYRKGVLLIATLFGGGDFLWRLYANEKKGDGPKTWAARLSSAAQRALTATGAMLGSSMLSHAANEEVGNSAPYDWYKNAGAKVSSSADEDPFFKQ